MTLNWRFLTGNLVDSSPAIGADGTIYVGGKIEGLGVDAVPGEMTDLDVQWLGRKLKMYGLEAPKGLKAMQKVVAGRQLWNYDNLEPTEKKLIL